METEVQAVDGQEVAESVAPEVQSAETPVETPAAESEQPVTEKMIPQSQVNKIAAREARQAAEKARQEMQAQYERMQVKDEVSQQAASQGGVANQTPEQLEQIIFKTAQKMSAQMQAEQMAKDFESKIEAEIKDDPDFGDLYDQMNMTQHPELVIWMNGMDNSAKVVKELAQNPEKFANILMLAKSGVPGLAKNALIRLSESIKTNQKAAKEQTAKAPLDQLSPSSIGAGNGEMSVSDFMKQPWLRG